MNCANCDTANIHPLPNEDVPLCSKACRDDRDLRQELAEAKKLNAEMLAMLRQLEFCITGIWCGICPLCRFSQSGVQVHKQGCELLALIRRAGGDA